MTILEQALAYYDQGLTIIPLKQGDKTPALETWLEYEKERPSREQTESWFSSNNVNIGIICGDVSNGLVVQDFDSEEAFTKFFGGNTDEIQADAPTIRTGRGIHVWYRTEEPGIRSFRVEELKMDLKANGGYVVAPPSIHPNGSTYTFLNGLREPLLIEHLVESIRKRCEQLGVKQPPTAGSWTPISGKVKVKPWRRHPAEIQAYFAPMEEGEREQRAFGLAALLLNEWEFNDVTTQEWLTVWNEQNKPPLEPTELEHALQSAKNGYVFSKETLQPIIKNLKRKLITADIEDSIFSPTPTEPLEYGSDEELWSEIVEFTKTNVELPEDVNYDVTTAFVHATWRVEQANNATYLNVLAPQGSGKSRLLEVLNWLCRMSIHSEGATRSAIVRASNGTNATLLLDEADNWLDDRDFDNQIMAVLNGGYRRRVFGGGTLLTENTGKNQFEVKALDSFGFKVIAGRNPLGPTLGSRCIPIRIRKSTKLFPVHIDYEKAWTLRRKLLAYSERHKDEPLECREVDDKIKDGRVREIFEPLVAAAPNQQIRNILLDHGVRVYGEKQNEEQTGDDAEVAAAIKNLDVGEATVSIIAVVKYLNESVTDPTEQWTNRKVGRIARRIGYNITHGRHGNMIQLDEKITHYLTERYSLKEKET